MAGCLNLFINAEEILAGTKIPGGGGRGRLYPTLHCHHRNDSCVKVGSDESRFSVSLTVRDKVTRDSPQTTTFEEMVAEAESNRGPSAYRPDALSPFLIGRMFLREASWKYSAKLVGS